MKTKKKKWRFIAKLMAAIVLLEQVISLVPTDYVIAAGETVEDCKFQHKIISSWEDGCNAEITLTNLSDSDAQNWIVTFCTTDLITDLWGGNIKKCVVNTISNNTPLADESIYYQYTVEALDYNASLLSGEQVIWGYSSQGNNHDIWDEEVTIVTQKDSEEKQTIDESVEGVNLIKKYSISDDCSIEVNVTDSWENYYNIKLFITNTSEETIHNWGLLLKTTDTISGLYNATEISNIDGVRLLKNAGYNQDIHVGETIEVGYIASYSYSPNVPDTFAISHIEEELTTKEYEVNLFITSQWENGGLAQIIIENTSDQTIEDWTIEFNSDLIIEEVWGGTIEEHIGDHYFIRNAEYAQNITSGETWTIGFTFSGDASDIHNIVAKQIVVSSNSSDRESNINSIVELDTSMATEDVGRMFYKELSSYDDIALSSDGLLYVKNQVLISVNGKDYNEIEELAEEYDAQIVGCIELTGDYQLEFKQNLDTNEFEKAIGDLRTKSYIKNAELNYLWLEGPNFYSSDPWYEGASEWSSVSTAAGTNWGIEAINFANGLVEAGVIDNLNASYNDVTIDHLSTAPIGILDTAFDEKHEDIIISQSWMNFEDPDELKNRFYGKKGHAENQSIAHGTKVAGVIGATFNNSLGITGVSIKHNLYAVSMDGEQSLWDSLDKRNSQQLDDHVFKVKCALGILIAVAKAKVINYSQGQDGMAFVLSRGRSSTDSKIQKQYDEAYAYYEKQSTSIADYLESLLALGYDFLIVTSAGNGNDKGFVEYSFWENSILETINAHYRIATSKDSGKKYGSSYSDSSVQHVCNYIDAQYNSIFNFIPDSSECYDHIICVGGIQPNTNESSQNRFEICSFSDRGDRVDVLAPGVTYTTTITGTAADDYNKTPMQNDNYDVYQGTSFAAPYVTGAIGLAYSVNPKISAVDLKQYIISSAKDMNLGTGVLDISSLIKSVKKSNQGQLIVNISDDNGNPLTGADVRICSTGICAKYLFTNILLYDSVDYSKVYLELTTNENGQIICDLPEGYYIVMADYHNTKGKTASVGWYQSNRGLFHDGLEAGKIYNLNMQLSPYSLNNTSNSIRFQIKDTNDNSLDGSTVKLYKGWGTSNLFQPVAQATGDSGWHVWGWVEMDVAPGIYTAVISKNGYQTKTVNVQVIADGKDYLIYLDKY